MSASYQRRKVSDVEDKTSKQAKPRKKGGKVQHFHNSTCPCADNKKAALKRAGLRSWA